MTDTPPAITEGWCPECESYRHSALVGGPCYCEDGEVKEVTMYPGADLRELVEHYRSINESYKGADRMADPTDYQRGVIDGAGLCADKLEELLE